MTDKESRIELQKIDCNCSDCVFMIRDSDRLKDSHDFHRKIQLNEFEMERKRLIGIAENYRIKEGNLDVWQTLHNEANKLKFQFDKKELNINYGACDKLNKPVSFIANTCQLDTQECFEHRRN